MAWKLKCCLQGGLGQEMWMEIKNEEYFLFGKIVFKRCCTSDRFLIKSRIGDWLKVFFFLHQFPFWWQAKDNWSVVFTIGALVHLFGITFYGVFACGELQDWAEPPVQEQTVWSPTKAGYTEETSFVSLNIFSALLFYANACSSVLSIYWPVVTVKC